jgi:FkbM family methyltransferase
MANAPATRSSLQRALMGLYRRLRKTRLLQSRFGRRLFEGAYLAYKIAEAGPIGRLKPYVTAGSWIVDVGANIGMFSDRFVVWTGANGRVIAIEPEAANFASLVRRLAIPIAQNRLVAVQAVAAETNGQLWLEVNPDHPGDHKIGQSGIPIAAVTLDVVLSQHGNPSVSLVKIDVQGAEFRVLSGATETLRRCRPALFIEVDRAAMQTQGTDVAELVDFLGALGYRPYRLRQFGPPVPATPQSLGSGGYEDILFLDESGGRGR